MTRFSYQLYSSRSFPPLDATLRMLAGIGYREVEGFAELFEDPSSTMDLAASLLDMGLTMPTAHVDLDLLEADPEMVIEVAARLGVATLYCPRLDPEARPTDAKGWVELGASVQAAGAPLRQVGLGFGWHNHDYEFLSLPDGSRPLDRIFEGGPDLEWQVDVAWAVRVGGDVTEAIAQHGGRITSAHIKDVAPEGRNLAENGWADVGDGIVDWPKVVAALSATGMAHFVVEHDDPSDDERFARASLRALRRFCRQAPRLTPR